MTSYYAAFGALRPRTMELYARMHRHRLRSDGLARLDFYLSYLEDVVPDGITVREGAAFQDPHLAVPCYEVDLILTDTGRIFMSGLVSKEWDHRKIERLAGHEATGLARDGHFVRDGGWWRFFTGLSQLRFFNSSGRGAWELMGMCDTNDAREVSNYLQEQYDSLASH